MATAFGLVIASRGKWEYNAEQSEISLGKQQELRSPSKSKLPSLFDDVNGIRQRHLHFVRPRCVLNWHGDADDYPIILSKCMVSWLWLYIVTQSQLVDKHVQRYFCMKAFEWKSLGHPWQSEVACIACLQSHIHLPRRCKALNSWRQKSLEVYKSVLWFFDVDFAALLLWGLDHFEPTLVTYAKAIGLSSQPWMAALVQVYRHATQVYRFIHIVESFRL